MAGWLTKAQTSQSVQQGERKRGREERGTDVSQTQASTEGKEWSREKVKREEREREKEKEKAESAENQCSLPSNPDNCWSN